MEKFSVKKPFTVLVGVIMVLLLGFVALSHMQTNLLPDISTPYLMVVTVYPGASPERVESEVADVMENALGTVAGVDTITSTSAENYNLLSAPILVTFGKDGTCTLNGSKIEVSTTEKRTEFTKNEDGSYTLALTVLNRKTPALPHTGADAPSLWLLIGLPLAVAGLLILVFRYNKKGGRTR